MLWGEIGEEGPKPCCIDSGESWNGLKKGKHMTGVGFEGNVLEGDLDKDESGDGRTHLEAPTNIQARYTEPGWWCRILVLNKKERLGALANPARG